MFETLKVRKQLLEEALHHKLAELRALCLKEGELTGELPIETPLSAREPVPQIRRRVGTAFTLNEKLLMKSKTKEEEILSKLELEYEIQSKIVAAATRLAKDVNAKKNVRKQRKQAYQQSLAKMKDMEGRLMAVRRQIATTKMAKSRRIQSAEDLSEDNVSHSADESREKCENSLKKFFVTESNNKQLLMKRSASLHTSLVPLPASPTPITTTNKQFNDNNNSSRILRPLSPSVTSLVNRVQAIQRPRSAAAKLEPTFDYDTDEESNEMLKNLNDFDNNSSAGSSGGDTNASVIYLGEQHKPKHIQTSPYVHSRYSNTSDQLDSVANHRRTSNVNKSYDDNQLRSTQHVQTITAKEPTVINKNYVYLQQNDNQNIQNSQLNRSNSLDNSQRRSRTSSQGSADSYQNLYSNDSQHHKHYHNHYPFYRANSRTDNTVDNVPKSPTPVAINHHMAKRPLPTLPTSECQSSKYLPPIRSPLVNPSESRLYYDYEPNQPMSPDMVCTDVTDRSMMSHIRNHQKTNQKSLFNFDEQIIARNDSISSQMTSPMSPHLVTSPKFMTNQSPVNKSQVKHNVQPVPPPASKAPKTWIETSLDSESTPRSTPSQSSHSNTSKDINERNTNQSIPDSDNELYVNVVNTAPIAPTTTSKALSTPSPPQSLPASTPPLASPVPTPSHMGSQMSIASISRSINGDNVSVKPSSIPLSPTVPSGNGVEVTVVSVGHFQPYWEEEKPFELADFYKYSQKHRNSQQPTPVPTHPSQSAIHYRQSSIVSQQSRPSSTVSPSLGAKPQPHDMTGQSSKGPAVVSDSFNNELIAWYDDRDTDQHNNNNNNNNSHNNNHNAKHNPTFV